LREGVQAGWGGAEAEGEADRVDENPNTTILK